MKNINKSFGSVRVLENASIHVRNKEIHALIGENGAGKSTLMKILTGVYTKDSGEIIINGKPQEIHSINDSEKLKIAIIHQELNVLGDMSIADNMFLGRELKNKFGFLDKKSMERIAGEKLKMLGLDINPRTLIKDISLGRRQLVEIAKALLLDAELIIMDEPTAALTEKETELLFKVVRSLRDKGVSFIYISHRMEEMFHLCDSITVLRDGKYVGTKAIKETSFDEIVSMMVGYDIDDRFPRVEASPGEVVLSVRGLTKKGKFENINFDLRGGEVLGFSGLMGSGRTDVMHAIFGSTSYESGEILINNQKVNIKSPLDAKKLGIGFITEDRKNEGLVLDFPVNKNMVLASLKEFKKGAFMDDQRIHKAADTFIKRLKIRTPNQEINVGKLSGGNQQKVVIAKWLITNPRILILDEPTRGVDVGAKREIYELINELKKEGVAIIVVSSELPEVLGVSDRIAVMHNKKLKKIFDIKEATQEKIMEYATGGGK